MPGRSLELGKSLRVAALLPILAALSALAAPAADGTEELSLVGAENHAIELTVPASGTVPLVLHRTPADEAAIYDVDLGPFLSEDDQELAVEIRPGGSVGRLELAEGEHRAVLELHAEELVPGVEYSGTLTVSSAEASTPWQVSLHRPRPRAELTTDLGKVTLEVVIGGPGGEDPARTVVVREKTGDVGVEGLTVRRADGSEPKGVIDISRNLWFELDGERIPNLTSWPDEAHQDLRTIPPGETRSLLVRTTDLARGEHEISLQLDAVNAKPDTAPKLDLVVQVRHSILWALLVLLLAISISFLITKGIVNWRQRLRLGERARSLDREWLRELPTLAPVIWLLATRRQTEVVLEQFRLLPTPEQLTDRLDAAGRLLALLRRYRDLCRKLDLCAFPYMLHYRMDQELDGIVGRIEPDSLGVEAATSFTTELDSFEQDLADPVSRYKPLVMNARRKARSSVRLDDIPTTTPAASSKLRTLMETYIEADPGDAPTTDELVLIDRVCASFRVLARTAKEDVPSSDPSDLSELVELVAQEDADKIPIDRVFALSNAMVSKRIEREIDKGRAYIVPSERRPKARAVEALRPTCFEIGLDAPELADRFMFKWRMLADWHFELQPEASTARWWRRRPVERKPIRWHATCHGNRLPQFAAEPGVLKMAVTLQHGETETRAIEGKLPITSSVGGFTSRLFALQEVVLVGVSMAIALASGLVLYYFSNPTFGSLQDYLALFTWGVGVDQGKNLVQTFQSLRSQSKADEEGTTK